MEERKYYVYAYYLKDTNEIFHIGKGTGSRYKEQRASRNQYFLNVIAKYGDNIDVKLLKDNLTEQEAWDLERQLIKEYQAIGQCKTNLHEGGCGGNTGNYDNPERSRKLSEFAKTRIGEKNPHYGKHLTEEQKQHLRDKQKEYWTEEKRQEQSEKLKGRPAWNKGLTMATDPRIKSSANKGVKMTTEQYNAMMDRECKNIYKIYLNEQLIFENMSYKKMMTYCSSELGISRTIVEKVIKGEWKPTFNKHKHLETLKIEKIDRKCID